MGAVCSSTAPAHADTPMAEPAKPDTTTQAPAQAAAAATAAAEPAPSSTSDAPAAAPAAADTGAAADKAPVATQGKAAAFLAQAKAQKRAVRRSSSAVAPPAAAIAERHASSLHDEPPRRQSSAPAVLQPSDPLLNASAAATNAARLRLLQKCFNALDMDGSGMVELEEWKRYLLGTGLPGAVVDAQVAKIVSTLDTDHDSKVCYKEFCKAFLIISKGMSDEDFVETVTGVVNACRDTANTKGANIHRGEKLSVQLVLRSLADETRSAKLRLCFQALDGNRSGFIEVDEFKKFLAMAPASGRDDQADKAVQGEDITSEVKSLMNHMDTNKDAKVSEDEFLNSLDVFKHSVRDEAFSKLVEGVFTACSGHVIESNVLKDALQGVPTAA